MLSRRLNRSIVALPLGELKYFIEFMIALSLALSFTFAEPPSPPGWTGWRGVNSDASVGHLPKEMPAKKLLWKFQVAGECHAGLAGTSELAVLADHGAGRDYWRALDIKSGKQVWEHSYLNEIKMDFGSAPRATPLIYKGHVYGLSARGNLLCLDLKTGKLIWKVNLTDKYVKDKGPDWGYCASPLVSAGKIVSMTGGKEFALVAVDPNSGKIVWQAQGVGTNYASFMSTKIGNTEQIIGYESKTICGWAASNGKKIWSMEIDPGDGYTVTTPIVSNGKLLLTTSAEETRLFDFDKDGKIIPKPVATSTDLWPEMSTPVVIGDLLLGSTEGLVALSLKDNLKTVWKFEDDAAIHGFNQFIASKDRVLVATEDGHILLFAVNGKDSKLIGKIKVSGDTMAHPAVIGDRLVVRDKEFVYCYRLK
jgi:outer membrane protein assembly factor BamB